ncbi:MAG: hypothetical protein V2A77_05250 [Pseudomonadota bacterium]
MTTDEIFETRRKHRANIPGKHHEAYRLNYDKALEGKSLKAAIKAKCLDCMCWEATEVKLCPCVACPLYEIRPYAKHPKRHPERKKAKNDMGASPNTPSCTPTIA